MNKLIQILKKLLQKPAGFFILICLLLTHIFAENRLVIHQQNQSRTEHPTAEIDSITITEEFNKSALILHKKNLTADSFSISNFDSISFYDDLIIDKRNPDLSPAESIAFPGAEGAGCHAQGGRGGDVYFVNSLQDDGSEGTLRKAISTATGPRTIIFNTSGAIKLNSPLNINRPYLTIAGQTAPDAGISIYGSVKIKAEAKHLILRHIRIRSHQKTGDGDALSIIGTDQIIDHVSASWSSDEVMSTGGTATDRLTMQHCIISEGLDTSYHVENNILIEHSMGSLLNSTLDSAVFTSHHNLYASNRSRNPKIASSGAGKGLTLDFCNNIIFNWLGYAGYSTDETGSLPKMNYIGNYLIAGPSTTSKGVSRAFNVMVPTMKIYQSGNYSDPDKDNTHNGNIVNDWSLFSGENGINWIKLDEPVHTPSVKTETAPQAYNRFIHSGGATPWNRDETDLRLIRQLTTRTDATYINWPYLAVGNTPGTTETEGDYRGYPVIAQHIRPDNQDKDQDGMPYDWEVANGLNPGNNNDRNDFSLSSKFTNLEVYLYWIIIHHEITSK
jgi:hypothetical protein